MLATSSPSLQRIGGRASPSLQRARLHSPPNSVSLGAAEHRIVEVVMAVRTPAPTNIDEYIAASSPKAQPILKKIRRTIGSAAPEAQEVISYRMPAFRLHGILIYFAAFKNHIGVYPPVSGDARLEKALSPYAGPKGNLKFPLDQPIPYALIRRIVLLKVEQARFGARRS